MRTLIYTSLAALLSISAWATTYSLDPAHTSVNFTAPHLVVSKVKGRFDNFSGSFDFDEKTQKLEKVNVVIKADSVNTNEKNRDKDLRSPNFLDVAKFPELKFVGTKTTYDNNKPTKVEGDLTIHGVTKKVTLDVDYTGAVTDPWGNRTVTFEAKTKIDRKDFGIVWNKALEAGGVLVGDEIRIMIDGEAHPPAAKK